MGFQPSAHLRGRNIGSSGAVSTAAIFDEDM